MTVSSAVPIKPLKRIEIDAPWAALEGYKGTFSERLSQEMSDFVNCIRPKDSEVQIREATVQRLAETIKSKWPTAKVTTFGSFSTGLYTSISDIDVNIEFPLHAVPSSMLRQIKQLVETSRLTTIGKAQALETAMVPLVKYEDAISHISVDVTCQNSRGPRTSQWLRNEVKQRPNIRAVILILKHFLLERRLNNVYAGGLGSYALYLMVVGFARYTGANHGHDLATLLLGFLDFWSKWNLKKGCLSFQDTDLVVSKPANKQGLRSLCIIDPLDPNIEIGHQSRHIVYIQEAFMKFASELRNSKSFQMQTDVAVPWCLGKSLAITWEELQALSLFRQLSATDGSSASQPLTSSSEDSSESAISLKITSNGDNEPDDDDDEAEVAFSLPNPRLTSAQAPRAQPLRQVINGRRLHTIGRRFKKLTSSQAPSAQSQKTQSQVDGNETVMVQTATLVDVSEREVQPLQDFIERQASERSTTMTDMIDLWIENISNGSTTDGEQVTTPTEGSTGPYSDDLFDALALQNKLGGSDPVSEILQELEGLQFGQADFPQTPSGLVDIVYDSD